MKNDIRLVPMTREQREALRDVAGDPRIWDVLKAYDAAPADPAQAMRANILRALDDCAATNEIEIVPHHLEYLANWASDGVLDVLGCALPRNEDHA